MIGLQLRLLRRGRQTGRRRTGLRLRLGRLERHLRLGGRLRPHLRPRLRSRRLDVDVRFLRSHPLELRHEPRPLRLHPLRRNLEALQRALELALEGEALLFERTVLRHQPCDLDRERRLIARRRRRGRSDGGACGGGG